MAKCQDSCGAARTCYRALSCCRVDSKLPEFQTTQYMTGSCVPRHRMWRALRGAVFSSLWEEMQDETICLLTLKGCPGLPQPPDTQIFYQSGRFVNLHSNYLLFHGAQWVLPSSLLPASLVHPVQWADIISVIGQFVIGQYVPQDVQVIQISSDCIMTVSG